LSKVFRTELCNIGRNGSQVSYLLGCMFSRPCH
jgi:hypothetical protein